MKRLSVSPALRNRSSVLPTARVIFARGQDFTLDDVVADALLGTVEAKAEKVEETPAERDAREAAMVAEYENYGAFGGWL